MREMEQNDYYDESEFEEGADLDTEAEEDTSTKINKLWGVPVSGFILGAVIVLILIIAVVVIGMKKNSGSSADIVQPDTSVTTVSRTECYANFTKVGYIDGAATVGATVYSVDGSVLGTLEASGATSIKDDWGAVLGYVTSPNLEPDVATNTSPQSTVTNTVNSSGFDEDTIKQLRKYGYTGDEIELAASSGVDPELLIQEAQLLYDEEAKAALERMSDSASEEFKGMVNTTQYCMPLQEFVPVDVMVQGYIREQHSYIVNADYEKIPTYGYQLRVKVKIANGTYAFMDIDPTRYASMPDSGNIVVEVFYTLYGPNAESVQFYITDLIEKDITTLTVNPEDSAVNLNDVINKGR